MQHICAYNAPPPGGVTTLWYTFFESWTELIFGAYHIHLSSKQRQWSFDKRDFSEAWQTFESSSDATTKSSVSHALVESITDRRKSGVYVHVRSHLRLDTSADRQPARCQQYRLSHLVQHIVHLHSTMTTSTLSTISALSPRTTDSPPTQYNDNQHAVNNIGSLSSYNR